MSASATSYKSLEQRIRQGEDKSAIYDSYTDAKNQKTVATLLAQIPTMTKRQKYRKLNLSLITCLIVLAVLRLLAALFLIFSQIPLGFALIFPGLVIPCCLIWGVYKYRGIAYFATFMLGLTGLLNTLKELVSHPSMIDIIVIIVDGVGVICIIGSMILSRILMQSLLPQTTFLMKPKVDAQGNPLFEADE
jgi:hypothetical protein